MLSSYIELLNFFFNPKKAVQKRVILIWFLAFSELTFLCSLVLLVASKLVFGELLDFYERFKNYLLLTLNLLIFCFLICNHTRNINMVVNTQTCIHFWHHRMCNSRVHGAKPLSWVTCVNMFYHETQCLAMKWMKLVVF